MIMSRIGKCWPVDWSSVCSNLVKLRGILEEKYCYYADTFEAKKGSSYRAVIEYSSQLCVSNSYKE